MARLGCGFLAALLAAAAACGGPIVKDIAPSGTSPDGARHHAAGFASADAHALPAKLLTEDCRGCHGTQLEGALEVACDSCHVAGWKADCTYCHGGTDNATGAPPRDLHGSATQDDLVFKSHTRHAETTVATPFGCQQCHGPMPSDALTPGHWFDPTPGRAEVKFADGLSAAGAYDEATGTCSNLYCHGNGQGNNGTAASAGPMDCGGCHAFQDSGTATIGTMSGEHQRHIVNENSACFECHGMTVDATDAIADATLHVNGTVEHLFPGTDVTYDPVAGTCNGTCHGQNHQGDGW